MIEVRAMSTTMPQHMPRPSRASRRNIAALGVLLTAIAYADTAAAESPGVSGWGPDNALRDFARAQTSAGRNTADTLSYVTLFVSLAQPAAFDAYKLADGDSRGALGAGAIDLVTVGAGFVTNHFVLKPVFGNIGFDNVRPMADQCPTDPHYDPYCTTSDLRQGNPSDHAAFSAMGLGLVLAKIATDPQFPRSPWIVGGSIALGTAAMLSTDYLRIAADKHWLSETLMGNAVGLAFGFFVPWTARELGIGYGRWESVRVQLAPSSTGMQLDLVMVL